MRLGRRVGLVLLIAVLALAACSDEGERPPSGDTAGPAPDWIEKIYPPPGADAAVPDAVEVRFDPQGPDRIVRLIIDGVDVTTYAAFDAGLVRYESGQGPITLGGKTHQVQVEITERPTNDATEYVVVDSYSWSYRAA